MARGEGVDQAVGDGRVVLRAPVRDDEAAWCRLRAESRALHAPWEPQPEAGFDPCGPEAFARVLEASESERSARFLAFSEGRLVAQVSLNEIVRGAFQSAYLGYWTGAPFAGRGFGTQAVSLATTRAFEDWGLHRVEANVQPSNAASLGIVWRLGFRREGLSPRYLKIASRWADHERWAITVEEWSPELGRAHDVRSD